MCVGLDALRLRAHRGTCSFRHGIRQRHLGLARRAAARWCGRRHSLSIGSKASCQCVGTINQRSGSHAGRQAGTRSQGHTESREVCPLMSTPAETTPQSCSQFSTADRPTWDLYSRCIHCGLCLSSCPTYRVLGTEMDSPRGRIYLMRAFDEGRAKVTDSFVEHMFRCLDCRACETACPSGVHFGQMMEEMRGRIVEDRSAPWLARLVLK